MTHPRRGDNPPGGAEVRLPADGSTEAEFLRQVLQLARICGWRSAHFRPARTATGWRTPLQGDAAGFPDLVLIRGPRLVVAEIKSERGRPTPEQSAWLAAFEGVGVEAFLWRPRDWAEIEATLRPEVEAP